MSFNWFDFHSETYSALNFNDIPMIEGVFNGMQSSNEFSKKRFVSEVEEFPNKEASIEGSKKRRRVEVESGGREALVQTVAFSSIPEVGFSLGMPSHLSSPEQDLVSFQGISSSTPLQQHQYPPQQKKQHSLQQQLHQSQDDTIEQQAAYVPPHPPYHPHPPQQQQHSLQQQQQLHQSQDDTIEQQAAYVPPQQYRQLSPQYHPHPPQQQQHSLQQQQQLHQSQDDTIEQQATYIPPPQQYRQLSPQYHQHPPQQHQHSLQQQQQLHQSKDDTVEPPTHLPMFLHQATNYMSENKLENNLAAIAYGIIAPSIPESMKNEDIVLFKRWLVIGIENRFLDCNSFAQKIRNRLTTYDISNLVELLKANYLFKEVIIDTKGTWRNREIRKLEEVGKLFNCMSIKEFLLMAEDYIGTKSISAIKLFLQRGQSKGTLTHGINLEGVYEVKMTKRSTDNRQISKNQIISIVDDNVDEDALAEQIFNVTTANTNVESVLSKKIITHAQIQLHNLKILNQSFNNLLAMAMNQAEKAQHLSPQSLDSTQNNLYQKKQLEYLAILKEQNHILSTVQNQQLAVESAILQQCDNGKL